jgi:hypothetical protein
MTYRVPLGESVNSRSDGSVNMTASRPNTGHHYYDPCPAATGVPRNPDHDGCGTYQDRAHRCRLDRFPHQPHACLCGQRWVSVAETAFVDVITALADTPRPRHAA